MAGFLTDYYSGAEGAGSLDWRDRREMINRGETLRYAPQDVAWLTDADIRDMVDRRGASIALPTRGGGYQTLDNPNVGPGGTRTISANEAIVRGRTAAAGGRALEDPGGILPTLERQNYTQQTNAALAQAEYLSQFLPPDRVLEEVKRMTGINLGEGLKTKTQFEREKIEAELGIRRDTLAVQRAKDKAPTEFEAKAGLYYKSMTQASQTLNETEAKGLSAVGLLEQVAPGDVVKNIIRSGDRQSYVQAQRQWIDSINRVRSGANLPEIEYARAVKTFFPEYGDDVKTVQQKQTARAAEEQWMRGAARNAVPQGAGTAPGAPQSQFQPASARDIISAGSGPSSIPPPAQREIGQTYDTPRGPLVWAGNGWLDPREAQVGAPQRAPAPNIPFSPAALGLQVGAGLVR